MSPINRCEALQPLSRDHHVALMLAQRVLHVLDGKAFAGAVVELEDLVGEAVEFHETYFLGHARAEEDVLLPHLRGVAEVPAAALERLLDEHARLEVLLGEVRDEGRTRQTRRESLAGYADLLVKHVRFEERELFEIVEAALAPAVLAEVGAALAEYEKMRDPSCRVG